MNDQSSRPLLIGTRMPHPLYRHRHWHVDVWDPEHPSERTTQPEIYASDTGRLGANGAATRLAKVKSDEHGHVTRQRMGYGRWSIYVWSGPDAVVKTENGYEYGANIVQQIRVAKRQCQDARCIENAAQSV